MSKHKGAGRQGQSPPASGVVPGMTVTTTDGDLGQDDVSKPKVAEVIEDKQGNIEGLLVKKGAIFRKKMVVRANRIDSVMEAGRRDDDNGQVTLKVSDSEADALGVAGTEELPSLDKARLPQGKGLGKLEEKLPTEEGLRRREGRRALASEAAEEPGEQAPHSWRDYARTLGPGFLSGMAGNDSSAVTSYSISGATAGYNQLWIILLATPLYQAVQYACAQIGRLRQRELSTLPREQYGNKIAIPASLLLIIANMARVAENAARSALDSN